jgi:hypothetical protein
MTNPPPRVFLGELKHPPTNAVLKKSFFPAFKESSAAILFFYQPGPALTLFSVCSVFLLLNPFDISEVPNPVKHIMLTQAPIMV